MTKIAEISDYAADIARQQGIQKYDIYGSTVDSTSVQVDQGEPKQVKASNRASIIVRVWNSDNTMGVTSTTDVDPNGIELALKTAHEASFYGIKENVPDFSPQASAPKATVAREKIPQTSVATLIEQLVSAEKELLAAHSAITGVPYNGLSQQDVNRFYLNSDGALCQEERSYASIYLYSKTEQEGKKSRSAGAFRINQSLDKLDVNGCIQETATKTISHLNYEKIKSGKYRVVLSADAFLSLIRAFSNLFNAQNILDKQSLSTPDSLGTVIASPLLSVFDDALHPENVAAETFDGEGTPTRRVPIITEGVLTNFLHSTGTAKRLNAQPTGHANIGAKVTLSPHFFHVTQGQAPSSTYSLDEAENVILIDDLKALHAGVNSLQGSFSLPFDGWIVNKGEKTSIDSATVAGDIRELLQAIIFVEAETELVSAGVSPRIWIDELSITG